MEIDIKKVMGETPNDGFEAVKMMVEAQGDLLDALHLLKSIAEFNTPEYAEIHEHRMNEFLKKFAKDEAATAG